jgi:hypothetical protein
VRLGPCVAVPCPTRTGVPPEWNRCRPDRPDHYIIHRQGEENRRTPVLAGEAGVLGHPAPRVAGGTVPTSTTGRGGWARQAGPGDIWPAAAPLTAVAAGTGPDWLSPADPLPVRAPPRVREPRGLPALKESYGHHDPKPQIVVIVVWDVPVAVGAASVPLIVVPGAPTHHADSGGPAPIDMRQSISPTGFRLPSSTSHPAAALPR